MIMGAAFSLLRPPWNNFLGTVAVFKICLKLLIELFAIARSLTLPWTARTLRVDGPGAIRTLDRPVSSRSKTSYEPVALTRLSYGPRLCRPTRFGVNKRILCSRAMIEGDTAAAERAARGAAGVSGVVPIRDRRARGITLQRFRARGASLGLPVRGEARKGRITAKS